MTAFPDSRPELEDDVAELVALFVQCPGDAVVSPAAKQQLRDALAKLIDTRIAALVPTLSCPHVWVRRLAGGAPDDEGSMEAVEYCDSCGMEKPDE